MSQLPDGSSCQYLYHGYFSYFSNELLQFTEGFRYPLAVLTEEIGHLLMLETLLAFLGKEAPCNALDLH